MAIQNERKPMKTEKQDVKEDEMLLPTPPDGGWGWVVVLGSFMIHVIADGVAYSFGIFFVEFLDYFKSGRGETGWVGSLMVGITWGSGPIASALTNKYGCRAVVIGGSFLAASGFIISIFSPNIWFLYFSFGIIGGIGLGLIYLPAIVSVTYYFEKRRAFATGLAVCGSGLGTFLFAPFTKYLVGEYTWKGAVLILSGLILNCILCGALFRPLVAKKRKSAVPIPDPNTPEEQKKLMNGTISSNGNPQAKESLKSSPSNPQDGRSANGIMAGVPLLTVTPSDGKSTFHSMHAIDTAVASSEHPLRSYASENLLHRVLKTHHTADTPTRDVVSPMARKDVFYGHSLQNIPMYRSNPSMYTQSILSLPHEVSKEKECCKICTCLKCSDEMLTTFRQMTDFSLLKDPLFLMFAISNFLTSIGFCVPYIFLPDRAMMLGIGEEKAAFLISVIGIANTVGRIVFGFISDLPCVNRLMLYNTALTLCGVATALSSFCVTYELLCAYSAAFGMFLGVYVSLTSVVLVDLLGLECLTNSFGLTLLFQGIAGIIGPPIAGWMSDATGNYDDAFYLMGVLIAASGIMLYFIPCVQLCLERRQAVKPHDMDMGRKVQDDNYLSTLDINAV